LLPYFNNGVVFGIPWNRNWKSSASNEQGFEVFYDFAQVSKGTTQADVFLARPAVAW
jgi:hypothetical protein